jgi:hypothetical protein
MRSRAGDDGSSRRWRATVRCWFGCVVIGVLTALVWLVASFGVPSSTSLPRRGGDGRPDGDDEGNDEPFGVSCGGHVGVRR